MGEKLWRGQWITNLGHRVGQDTPALQSLLLHGEVCQISNDLSDRRIFTDTSMDAFIAVMMWMDATRLTNSSNPRFANFS